MDNIYKQALDMENRFKSYVDDWNSPAAQRLRQDIQRLLDDIQVKKNTRTLEQSAQSLRRQIESLPDDKVMDHRDQDDLKDRCDDLIQALRRVS